MIILNFNEYLKTPSTEVWWGSKLIRHGINLLRNLGASVCSEL